MNRNRCIACWHLPFIDRSYPLLGVFVFCCHSAPRGNDAPMVLVIGAGSFQSSIVFPIAFRFSADVIDADNGVKR